MLFDKDWAGNKSFLRTKEMWQQVSGAVPEHLPEVPDARKIENEKWIDEAGQEIQKLLKSYRSHRHFKWTRRRWKKRAFALAETMLSRETVIGIDRGFTHDELNDVRDEMLVFLKKALDFQPDISMEDAGQALRNYMVYSIFRKIHNTGQKCTDAIFGYSMLYPYTDNYIDDSLHTAKEKKQYNHMICQKLKGENVKVTGEYEKKTCALLDAIINEYAPDATDICNGLLYMLDAQKESMRQDNEADLTEEEIQDISVFKGGQSVILDRCFVPVKLTEEDKDFYIGYGFFLQLADDLQDVTEDKKAGRKTLFTCCKGPKERELTVNRLINYVKLLFDSYEIRNNGLKEFLVENCIQLVAVSLYGSREEFEAEYVEKIAASLPVTSELMERLMENGGIMGGESNLKDDGAWKEMLRAVLE